MMNILWDQRKPVLLHLFLFVEEGISQTLEEVPKEKVINGVPFYTRLWTESNNGTVSSEVCGMDQADAYVEKYGMEVYWNTEVSQNYAEATTDGGVLKMWIEDEKSLEEKMKLIQEYDLAEWQNGSLALNGQMSGRSSASIYNKKV